MVNLSSCQMFSSIFQMLRAVKSDYTLDQDMTRSVYITTPIPTLDEVAKDLGISKARKDSILRIMRAEKNVKSRRSTNGPGGFIVSRRAGAKVAKTTIAAGKKARKVA
jgi:hypothetical protein